jgi:hypothetical protein
LYPTLKNYLLLLRSSGSAELWSVVPQVSAVIGNPYFAAFQSLALGGVFYFPQFQLPTSGENHVLPVQMQVVVLLQFHLLLR